MYIALIFVMPFTGIAQFSRLRHIKKYGAYTSFGLMALTHLVIGKICILPSDMKLFTKYEELYEKYKFDVLDPALRGKKLTKGKLPSQIAKEEFTSSKFNELRAIVLNNLK